MAETKCAFLDEERSLETGKVPAELWTAPGLRLWWVTLSSFLGSQSSRVIEFCFSLLFCKGQEFTARLPEGAGKAAAFEWPGWVLGSRSFSEITSVIWTIKHTGWILSDISYKLFLFSCLMIFMNQLEQRNNMMQTESREDKLNFNDTTLSTINISLTKTTNPFGH